MAIIILILIVFVIFVVLGLTGWGLQVVARILGFLWQGVGLGIGCFIKIILAIGIIAAIIAGMT